MLTKSQPGHFRPVASSLLPPTCLVCVAGWVVRHCVVGAGEGDLRSGAVAATAICEHGGACICTCMHSSVCLRVVLYILAVALKAYCTADIGSA